MKLISRRYFIRGASAIAIAVATTAPQPLKAWIHGSITAPSQPSNTRSVINVNNSVTMNVFKGSGYGAVDPNNQSANGYPITAPLVQSFLTFTGQSASYFGKNVLKWTGKGGLFMSVGLLIYSGDSDIQNGKTTTGSLISTGGNTTINGPAGAGATAPRIVFAFGFPATNVFKAPSTNLIRISSPTGYVAGSNNNWNTGDLVQVQNVGGQIAANGQFAVTVIDAQTIELQGSTWNAGTPYTSGGEVIHPAAAQSFSLRLQDVGNSGVFSNFDNLVLCTTGDETAVDAGQVFAQSYVDQINYLKPGWLRFMDAMQVQGTWTSDFSARQTKAFAFYGGNYCQATYVPAPTAGKNIFRGGSDAYTCAAPSTWPGLVDNAIVQGIIDTTNSGVLPTLNVAGTGAVPIVDNSIRPVRIIFSAGASGAGVTLTYRFTASWLAGGFRDVSYVTVFGDTNQNTLGVNVLNTIGGDAVLKAAGIGVGNDGSGGAIIYYPAAPSGVLTLTYTVGPAICAVTTLPAGTLNTGSNGASFIYSKLLGAWIYQSGGIAQPMPCEAIVELCNRTNANCWVNYPIFTKGQYITDFTSFMGDGTTGLTSGLQFGMEFGNEIFLFAGSALPARCTALGGCLGFVAVGDTTSSAHSWAGAKISQYAPLSKNAWTAKGRSASDHYVLNMGQYGGTSNWNSYQAAGALLGSSLYTTYGGMGVGATPNASIAGSQPIDVSDVGGSAPYWKGPFFGDTSGNITGTTTENNVWLAASLLYAQGSTSAAFDALYQSFLCVNVPASRTRNFNTVVEAQTNNVTWYTALSAYDARRAAAGQKKLGYFEYEGGPQYSIGGNLINGTNSPTDSISSLASRMTALVWNVDAFDNLGGTGATAITDVATQVNAMLYAFKFSTQYYNLFKLRYTEMIGAFADREARPGQYGYTGNTWSIYASTAAQAANTPYSSAQAIHDFNNTVYSYYEGLVATRCRMMGSTTSPGNTQIMFRSAHIATENLSAIRVNIQNFFNCTNAGGSPITDSGRGAATSVFAAVEYNGVCTQLTFGGFVPASLGAKSIPDISTAWSDYCGVNIPVGATFWIRIFSTNSAGVIFNNFQNTTLGECLQVAASGLTDLTLTPGTFTQTGVPWSTPPLAIVGITQNASMVIVSDSIGAGQNDTEAASFDGKVGTVARSLGSVPFVIIGRSGAKAQTWATDAVAANAILRKGSHLFIGLGTNDIAGGARTSAQVVTDIGAIEALAWSKQKVFIGTLAPRSTGSWGTLVAQTTADNATRTTLNNAIRAIPAGFPTNTTGKYDIVSALESSLNSGLWTVTPTPPYTADGVHPTPSGYLLVPAAGVVLVPSWP